MFAALPGPLTAGGVPPWVGPAGFLELTPPLLLHLVHRAVCEHASWRRAKINTARSLLRKGVCLCVCWVGGGLRQGTWGPLVSRRPERGGHEGETGVGPVVLRARGAQRWGNRPLPLALSSVCCERLHRHHQKVIPMATTAAGAVEGNRRVLALTSPVLPPPTDGRIQVHTHQLTEPVLLTPAT